jgi:hypothetical protein
MPKALGCHPHAVWRDPAWQLVQRRVAYLRCAGWLASARRGPPTIPRVRLRPCRDCTARWGADAWRGSPETGHGRRGYSARVTLYRGVDERRRPVSKYALCLEYARGGAT